MTGFKGILPTSFIINNFREQAKCRLKTCVVPLEAVPENNKMLEEVYTHIRGSHDLGLMKIAMG